MASLIGLYGGMANNMYVLAKGLAAEGVPVRFIRDRTDNFAFSQPSWEDCWAVMDYETVPTTASWTADHWNEWEAAAGWQRPDWLVEAADYASMVGGRHPNPKWAAILAAMSECDALIVCGVEGASLAALSGKPFVIIPHGGDIRIAARLARFGSGIRPWNAITGTPEERLLRAAYRRAVAVCTHGPLRLSGPLGRMGFTFKLRMPLTRFARLALPAFSHPRRDRVTRRRDLADLMERLNLPVPEADVVAFVPSRVDYYWKGQDRLLPALTDAAAARRLHLIFTGWGRDFDDLRRRVPAGSATFLPFALSKPALSEFYQAADLVIDQFVLGHYGTATQEAMACGAPVMLNCDFDEYERNGWMPPPAINASSAEEIADAFNRIAANAIDLEKTGADGHKWIMALHGTPKVANTVQSLLA